jgi:hypothetical protein
MSEKYFKKQLQLYFQTCLQKYINLKLKKNLKYLKYF